MIILKKERLASLTLILCALIWGVSFSAVDLALANGFKTFTILAFRGLISGFMLLPFAIKKKFWLNKKNIIHAFIAGVIFFLGYAFQTLGQELSGVVNSAFYTALYTIFTPFLALIFGKREVGLKNFLAAFVAFIGLYFLNILATGNKFSFGLGDIYLLLCAFFFALQIVWVNRFFGKDYDPISSSSIMMLALGFSALICVPIFNESFPNKADNNVLLGFLSILYAAIMSSGICSLLQLFGQKHTSAAKASILLSLETTFACFAAIIIGTDSMNIFSGFGLIFMIVSVLLVEMPGRKRYDFSKYEYLLIDVDDTILDFKKAEKKAFKKLFKELNVPYKKEYLNIYSSDNLALWKAYEKKEIKRSDIFDNRFNNLFEKLKIDSSPKDASYHFLDLLADEAHILNGSDKELKRLAKKYKLVIISNGEPIVQNNRLVKADIKKYFSFIFLSEEIGHQKPSEAFFMHVEKNIPNFDKRKAIVIGDSLSSDILGAISYNIDSCWITSSKEKNPTVNYQIKSLKQII